MIDIEEAVLAVEAVREISEKPIIANMTYSQTGKGYYTVMGNSLAECTEKYLAAGADIIGSNCNLDSVELYGLAEELLQLTTTPISIKPNAGQPVLNGNTVYYEQSAEEFVNGMKNIYELGIQILGGCCGSTPEYIKRLSEQLKV